MAADFIPSFTGIRKRAERLVQLIPPVFGVTSEDVRERGLPDDVNA